MSAEAALQPQAVFAKVDATPVDFDACGGAREDACNQTSADDAGASGSIHNCQISMPSALDLLNLSSAVCSDLQVVNAGSDAPSSIRLDGVDWREINLSLSSTSPLTLELDGASLDVVFVELTGPITLRIVDSVALAELHVASTSTTGDQPRLELLQDEAEKLVVGGTEHPFSGSVSMTRTQLTSSQLVADTFELESVTLLSGLIEASSLDGTDLQLSDTVLALENATISASLLQQTEIADCGALTLIRDHLVNTHIPPCREPPLLVYSTSVGGGRVGGQIVSDLSGWNGTRFGLEEPTDIVMWGGGVMGGSFCAGTSTARFGAVANVQCSVCAREALAEPGAVCRIPEFSPIFRLNVCPALIDPTECPEPFPHRQRPIPISAGWL
jgi:hypothetical protein